MKKRFVFILKRRGTKDISLKVASVCNEKNYSKSIRVNEGQSISIGSFTSNTDVYCEGDRVRFDVDFENDSVDLRWIFSTLDFDRSSGGDLNDTFFDGTIERAGDLKMRVLLSGRCGLDYEHLVTSADHSNVFIEQNYCRETCIEIRDSCYRFSESGTYTIDASPNAQECDSTLRLRLNVFDILPSPQMECQPTNDGVHIEWENVSGANSYIVFANRDSIATVTGNSYFIENAVINTPLVVKVQPIGECTYLPAEINCTGLVKTKSNFSNNKISIFPNPTTGIVNIETDLKIEEIEIYDPSGRFLQKEKRLLLI